ncbi:MAG TPA: hypothetical protein VGN75_03790 [Kaistia sp.]|jgi:hypothetical protein|nr:hypothetical protein [Kaistia sp.]
MRLDPDHIGIWGRTKSGKTTRAALLLRGHARVVAYDPFEQFSRLATARATTLTGVLHAVDAQWRARRWCVQYVPPKGVDPQEAMHRLCELLFQVQEGYYRREHDNQVMFAVDEMADPCPNVIPKKGMDGFRRMCRFGRHYGIGVIGTSQRMADVTTAFRGNTSQDYFFPLRGERDYVAAEGLLGRQHRDALRALQPHRAIHWVDGAANLVRNPPIQKKNCL